MRVFISQPMKGLSLDVILSRREKAKLDLFKRLANHDIEFIDTWIDEQSAVISLGESIKRLDSADVAYFMRGWEKYRGCRIEHQVAVEYGIRCIIYEG